MADNMSKLSINPNLVGFGFYYKFLSSILEKWQPFFVILGKVQFLLQVPIINFREMAANFVILGNG